MPRRKFAATRTVYDYAGLARHRTELDALAKANLHYTVGYYSRLACLPSRKFRRRLYAEMEPIGTEVLETAAREGRGVVLLSTHLGDFDAAGAWLGEVVGLTPVVAQSKVSSHFRQSFFHGVRGACGVVLHDRSSTRLADLAAELRRGRLVLVMVDRTTVGRTVPAEFLHRPIAAPAAAIELALDTESILVPGATWRSPGGRNVLWAGRPQLFSGAPEGGYRELQDALDELAWAVRRAPHQFHIPAELTQMSWLSLAAQNGLPHIQPSEVLVR